MRCLLVVLGLLFALAHATMKPLPKPQPIHPKSGLKAVDVFWRGEQGDNGKVYPCIRIPALIVAEAGGVESLVAFAECRMRVGDGCNPTGVSSQPGDNDSVDVCMKTSSDEGATWSDLQVIVESAEQPTAVFNGQAEQIILQVNHGGHIAQVTSKDLGATWTDPTPIDGSFGNATDTAVGPGRGLQLSAEHPKHPNRVLFIGHHGAYQEDYVWYSDDAQTYQVSSTALPLMDEATLVELPNGDVMANMRNNHANVTCPCRGISISQDGGETWGAIFYDHQLPEPVCMASIVSNDDGDFFFSNPGTTQGRFNGTVLKSEDGATSWTKMVTVNPGGGFAYSCLSPSTDEGAMGLLWETNADGCSATSNACRIVFTPIQSEAFVAI